MYSSNIPLTSENGSDKQIYSADTPVYIEGSPIVWDNNKATLHGVLHDTG